MLAMNDEEVSHMPLYQLYVCMTIASAGQGGSVAMCFQIIPPDRR